LVLVAAVAVSAVAWLVAEELSIGSDAPLLHWCFRNSSLEINSLKSVKAA